MQTDGAEAWDKTQKNNCYIDTTDGVKCPLYVFTCVTNMKSTRI